MTNRQLSERLCDLGCRLDSLSDGDQDILAIANELHALSNETFTPGTSWTDLKRVPGQPTRKLKYVNNNREIPF